MSPLSLPARIAGQARRKMYEIFLRETALQPDDTILDVGTTSDGTYESSNYLESWYPNRAKITAVGIDDAGIIESRYPGVRFLRADGCQLPFREDSFDVVHSSAVLEHVGSHERQQTFVRELVRVARRVVHLTTPNRWFPVEFHTQLPLVHWLPRDLFRRLLSFVHRYEYFSREEHLNLLDSRDLRSLCAGLGATDLLRLRLFGWPSNLLVTIRKT